MRKEIARYTFVVYLKDEQEEEFQDLPRLISEAEEIIENGLDEGYSVSVTEEVRSNV